LGEIGDGRGVGEMIWALEEIDNEMRKISAIGSGMGLW